MKQNNSKKTKTDKDLKLNKNDQWRIEYAKQIRKIRLQNAGINNGMNSEEQVINKGHIDMMKRSENTRILSINLRGLDL